MTTLICGDSISTGVGASATAKSYAALLAGYLCSGISNIAVSGSMVPDQAVPLYQNSIVNDDRSVLMLGTNDSVKYGLDAEKRGFFLDGIRALAIYMASHVVPATPANGVTFTGAWATNPNAYGAYGTLVTGAKAEFSFSGTSLALGFIRQLGNTGSFKVAIDGVDCGVFSAGGTVSSILGKTWGPAALCFTGLPAGNHAVTVELIGSSSGYSTFFHWFSTLDQKAKVCVANVPYSLTYAAGTSQANIDAYNADLSILVSQLSAIGLDVSLVDICGILTTADMADSQHPNDAGHMKISRAVYTALTGLVAPPVMTATAVYVGSDGIPYIKIGNSYRQISVN